jgi:hypothetical protein
LDGLLSENLAVSFELPLMQTIVIGIIASNKPPLALKIEEFEEVLG